MKSKRIDKNSYQYYKILHKATKTYYGRKGYVDQAGNRYADVKMLSKEDWEYQHNIKGSSNKEIVYDEFHEWTGKQARQLKKTFEESGIKLSLKSIARGNLTDEAWEAIKKSYYKLRNDEGMSGTHAKNKIANIFWGSD